MALLLENESEAERAARETAAYRAHPYLRRQWVAAPEIFDDAIEYRKSAEEHTDAFQRGVDVNAVIRLIESDKNKAEAAHKVEGKPGERPILGSIHRKTAIRFLGLRNYEIGVWSVVCGLPQRVSHAMQRPEGFSELHWLLYCCVDGSGTIYSRERVGLVVFREGRVLSSRTTVL